MNTSRRRVVAVGVQALFIAGLPGCVTSKLYQQPEKRQLSRKESVSALLLSADEKYLVALCPEFHYVFETSPSLVTFLRSRLHEKGEASLKSMHIDKDGKTAISYAIRLPDSLDADEEKLAMAMGFKKKKTWVLEESLSGTCYRAEDKQFNNLDMVRLNKSYDVTVFYEETGVPLALKVAATPLALAADGVTVVLVLPIAALSLIPIIGFLAIWAKSN